MLYAVIIVLWICILLPMWLRRHDEALESRSVDRFSSAMRTLSSRSAGDRREVVMPARLPEPIHADGTAAAVAEGRAVLAARRRRTLGVLAAVTLVVVGLTLLGPLPVWAAALPALLLAGFLVHLRRETTAQGVRDRRRAAQRARADSRVRRAAPEHRDAVERSTPAARTATWAHHEVDLADVVLEPAMVATADDRAAASAVDLPYDSEVDRAWAPVPVPLPTYVTAPKAPRSVRVIDLTKPGLWTSGHVDPEEAERLAAEALAHDERTEADPAGAAAAVRHEPAEGDGIVTGEVVIERRRAVNG
ncbi:MAG TPA: hypothetical protein VEV13_03830 [Candidatus Limnocylindria bacterium]|nr:hypothetical protein [Candidatus Limnocylindria bacterium]